jgi:2-amino-4,5-dihydroxy-6-oxo-7-(phosphooxy)heptanoate synthase
MTQQIQTSTKALRLSRLGRRPGGRLFIVPLDHSVSDGPITGADRFSALVGALARGGADAVVVHNGRVRAIDPDALAGCALIVHLSASTRHAPDADAKVLVSSVEHAIRLGADAVSVHVNVGSETEVQQLRDLGLVAETCDAWGMPLLAMMYPRGARISDPHAPDVVAHVGAIAADLGADIVKTPYTGSCATMARVVESCPLPMVIAGGPPDDGDDVLRMTSEAMRAGVRGVAIGRRVFTAPDPAEVARAIARIVHHDGHDQDGHDQDGHRAANTAHAVQAAVGGM